MSNTKNEPSLPERPDGVHVEEKSKPRTSTRDDLRQKVLDLVKQEGYDKLPSEWCLDSDLFDFDTPDNLDRIPKLLYNNKKNTQDIRLRTLAAPFQPVKQFGKAKKGDWVNQLIWGDNAQALQHLIKTGLKGKVRLIYIDPPFAAKSEFDKNGDVIAYVDKIMGAEYIEFMRERLVLLRELLAEDGSIYVHLDSKMNSYVRVAMDEIFGKHNFVNEIVWHYAGGTDLGKGFNKKHDSIYLYAKSDRQIFNNIYTPFDESTIKRFNKEDEHGRYKLNKLKDGRVYKTYMKTEGKKINDVWYINIIVSSHDEHTGYPTQKPKELLERIIKASSNEGDIVLDCFCGSGTALAVAERLGRRWIGVDAGKVAIHTTRTRILNITKRKPFAIYNSGVYAMKDVGSGIQVDINEKLYKEFACALFGIDTSRSRKDRGVEYDGLGRSNIRTKVLPSKGYVTMSYLRRLALHVGGGKIYIIYSQNQDCVPAHRLKIEGVEFYLHKIPHSIVGQFVLDCGYGGDGSAIIRNLHDLVLCKAEQQDKQGTAKKTVNKQALAKLGKIAQPKSKKEVEQRFTNIVGFDFVDTTKFDIDVKVVTKTKDGIRFKFNKVVTPSGEGLAKLATILVDRNYNGKIFKPQTMIWANNSVEENEDGRKEEDVGFAARGEFTVPFTSKTIALAYIDDFGNELIQVLDT